VFVCVRTPVCVFCQWLGFCRPLPNPALKLPPQNSLQYLMDVTVIRTVLIVKLFTSMDTTRCVACKESQGTQSLIGDTRDPPDMYCDECYAQKDALVKQNMMKAIFGAGLNSPGDLAEKMRQEGRVQCPKCKDWTLFPDRTSGRCTWCCED
jgi:hypothetical protein